MPPTFFYCPLPFHTSQHASEHAQKAVKGPYKCMHSHSLSDLMKSTEVDEGLSKTSTRCSVPENTNQLQD